MSHFLFFLQKNKMKKLKKIRVGKSKITRCISLEKSEESPKALRFNFQEHEMIVNFGLSTPFFEFRKAIIVIGGSICHEIEWKEFQQNLFSLKWAIFMGTKKSLGVFFPLFYDDFCRSPFALFPGVGVYHHFYLQIEFNSSEQKSNFEKNVSVDCLVPETPRVRVENKLTALNQISQKEDFYLPFCEKEVAVHQNFDFMKTQRIVMIKLPVPVSDFIFLDTNTQQRLHYSRDERGYHVYSLYPLKNGTFPVHFLDFEDSVSSVRIVPFEMERSYIFDHIEIYSMNFSILHHGMVFNKFCR
jgi:hypothetical protein